MNAPSERPARKSPDMRWRTVVLAIAVVALGGALVAGIPEGGLLQRPGSTAGAAPGAQTPVLDSVRAEIHQRFQQGVVMLHAKQHEHAIAAFHRVLELDPAMPEAHVNMGFALIGLERHAAARDFFEGAIALRRDQVNAYYGLAIALDGLNDRSGAIGAMRTFVHLSRPEDPFRRKALSALWEWESGGPGSP